MERTEQMYTLQKQLEFGKKKVRSSGSGGGNNSSGVCSLTHPRSVGGSWESSQEALTSCSIAAASSTITAPCPERAVCPAVLASAEGSGHSPCQLGRLSRAVLWGLRLSARTVAVSSCLKAAVKPCRCASLPRFRGLRGARLLPPASWKGSWKRCLNGCDVSIPSDPRVHCRFRYSFAACESGGKSGSPRVRFSLSR